MAAEGSETADVGGSVTAVVGGSEKTVVRGSEARETAAVEEVVCSKTTLTPERSTKIVMNKKNDSPR
jgi:hypothetical protein